MHGFIHPQAFPVRPIQGFFSLPGHLFGIIQGPEFHELGLRGGFKFFKNIPQADSHPRDDHEPCFHATKPVYPLLKRREINYILESLFSLFFAVPGYLDTPRFGNKRVCVSVRISFVRSELVQIVVTG